MSIFDDQVWNIVVFEFLMEDSHDGYAKLTCTAATQDDDAIQLGLDSLTDQAIEHVAISRLYSEREPGPEWQAYLDKNLPHVAVTWSFSAGQDIEFETAVEQLMEEPRRPWWKFW